MIFFIIQIVYKLIKGAFMIRVPQQKPGHPFVLCYEFQSKDFTKWMLWDTKQWKGGICVAINDSNQLNKFWMSCSSINKKGMQD
jgi:hypothetical protein